MGAGYNYTLNYKKFNQLLDEIRVDFKNFDLEGLIEPQSLIKVAKRVNYDLGLRIFKTKEEVLEVEKGNVKLPDDFYVLNFALLCDEYTVYTPSPQGTWIEERPWITPYRETNAHPSSCEIGPVNCQNCGNIDCSCDPVPSVAPYNVQQPYGSYCIKPRVFLNCKGEAYELVQIVKSGEERTYKRLQPLRMLPNAQSVDCDCPNINMRCDNHAWIKDGYLYTTFDCGKVYINYQGMLEDDDGDLLIPDHDMLNEYYEYALKQRILENMVMNGESNAATKLQLIEVRYRTARNYALSIVNTPNWSEMKQIVEINRKAQYNKYYRMFSSLGFDYGKYY